MRISLWGFATAALISCSPPSERGHGALMDEIESAIRLPEEAASLSDYARFYAPSGAGRIFAVYVIPSKPLAHAQSCEELQPDLTSKPVKCEAAPQDEWRTAGADERRWVSKEELPLVLDGGCSFIEVVFDAARHRVIRADCNGEA